MENKNESAGFGPMVAIIIVVIMLLVGGYYFAKQRIQKSAEFQSDIKEQMEPTDILDNVSDIEKDLDSLDMEEIDESLKDL